MTTIQVSGMKCQHCAGSVKKVFEQIETVSDVTVDLDNGSVTFEGKADMEQLKPLIEKAGFRVVS